MSIVTKIIIAIVVLALASFGIAFFTARYLVGKLDGRGNVPAQQTLVPYSSEDGISFMYPDTYELSSRREGNGERNWDVLVLLPKGSAATPNSEGPPSISMSVFQNIEGTPLETWIKGDARSNYKLSNDGVLGSTEIGGEPAFMYRHSGLYETDAFAVEHKGKIFLFEAGWNAIQDQIRPDFQTLVSSVQFTQ